MRLLWREWWTLVSDTRLLRCRQQLAAAGLSEPAGANLVLGTDAADDFSASLTDGNDVLCGFGGNDSTDLRTTLAFGDVFLGGDDNDSAFAGEIGRTLPCEPNDS